MDRREWLRSAALIAAGVVAADQLELVERLGWKRRFFPGATLLGERADWLWRSVRQRGPSVIHVTSEDALSEVVRAFGGEFATDRPATEHLWASRAGAVLGVPVYTHLSVKIPTPADGGWQMMCDAHNPRLVRMTA